MKWFYECFGISKQAFYKRQNSYKESQNQDQKLIEMVNQERKRVNSKTGGIKLYSALKPAMNELGIKKGRDKFYDFLRANKLLVPRTKNFHITTDSNHRYHKYPNLVQNMVPTRPEQLFVSDITYIKTQNGHNYLALVTDAYSKQIMGYKLANHMKASLCTEALDMAIKNRLYPNKPLIHHSDRGFQYCSTEYVKFATDNKIKMSMTEQYDPYENAIAERINRTLKYEFGLREVIKNTSLAKKMVKHSVEVYNERRLHLSLNMLTPASVHKNPTIEYKSYKKNKSSIKKMLT